LFGRRAAGNDTPIHHLPRHPCSLARRSRDCCRPGRPPRPPGRRCTASVCAWNACTARPCPRSCLT